MLEAWRGAAHAWNPYVRARAGRARELRSGAVAQPSILALHVRHPAAVPQLVADGLRNPWRFSFDRATVDLYIGDVGADTWEEMNPWTATKSLPPGPCDPRRRRAGWCSSAVVPLAERQTATAASISPVLARRTNTAAQPAARRDDFHLAGRSYRRPARKETTCLGSRRSVG
jgi:hypothetical protein